MPLAAVCRQQEGTHGREPARQRHIHPTSKYRWRRCSDNRLHGGSDAAPGVHGGLLLLPCRQGVEEQFPQARRHACARGGPADAFACTACFGGEIGQRRAQATQVQVGKHHSAVRLVFGPFPGRLAGFSCVRSRNTPFMPPAKPTLPSPKRSRNLSAAASACCQRWWRPPSRRSSCPGCASSNDDTCTPSRRTSEPFFQLRRNSARICSKISVSSCVGEESVCARVMVVKSLYRSLSWMVRAWRACSR